MILDYLENKEHYDKMNPQFSKAMAFALSLQEKPVGRYEEGDYFVLIQEMETVPLDTKRYELHKKYLDVHITLAGEETIEYEDIRFLSPLEEYNPEKDIQYMKGTGCPVVVKEGMFCLVLPHDGHKTGCCSKTPDKLRKMVVKIPV